MAASRRDYVCITDMGRVKKYASQSIGQIIDEKEDPGDQFISIISIGLSDICQDGTSEFEPLEWHD